MKKHFFLNLLFELKSKPKSHYAVYIQKSTCIWRKALLLTRNAINKKGSAWGFLAFLQLQCPDQMHAWGREGHH